MSSGAATSRRASLIALVFTLLATQFVFAARQAPTASAAVGPTFYEPPLYYEMELYPRGVTDGGHIIGNWGYQLRKWDRHTETTTQIHPTEASFEYATYHSNSAVSLSTSPQTLGVSASGDAGAFALPPGKDRGGPSFVNRDMIGVGHTFDSGTYRTYTWEGLNGFPTLVPGVGTPLAVNSALEVLYSEDGIRTTPGGITYGDTLPGRLVDFNEAGRLVTTAPGYTGAIVEPGGATTAIPFLPRSVNSDGAMVGEARIPEDDQVRQVAMFRTADGVVAELGDLLPSNRLPNGTEIIAVTDARSISDDCHVLATAQLASSGGGETRRFIVVQLPDCGAEALDGSIGRAAQSSSPVIPAGDDVVLRATVENVTEETVTGLQMVGDGRVLGTDGIEDVVMTLPDQPRFVSTLGPAAEATFDFPVVVTGAGSVTFEFDVQATSASGSLVEKTITGTFKVGEKPDVAVELTSSVTSETKVDDTFQIFATLTNNEEETQMLDVTTDGFTIDDPGLVEKIDGPLNENGNDPKTDKLTVEPGDSTTFTWNYKAVAKGSFTAEGFVAYRDASNDALYIDGDTVTIAIESPGLELTELRLSPGDPVPGSFPNIRGKITNIGPEDVTGIDFDWDSTPGSTVVEELFENFDADIRPRISKLEPAETRDFLIPLQVTDDVGELGSFAGDLTFTGTSELDGSDIQVDTTGRVAAELDLETYVTTILPEVKRLLLQGLFDLVDDIDAFGDEGGLVGGASVGTAETTLKLLQKLGDGLLTANDLIGEASGDGGERLTNDGKAIVQAIVEYKNTHTKKEMLFDFGDVSMDQLDKFANWMYDVETAYDSGDSRKVSGLITEPGLTFASGIGFEKATAQLLGKLWGLRAPRGEITTKKRAPDVPDADTPDTDVPHARRYAADGEDIKDLPNGVPLTGQTVQRFGINPDEHAWMIEMAKKYKIQFAVRPRPEPGAKWARLGYNAKPMAIKLKSVSDIDVEWLGYDDFKGKEGIVVFRKPESPAEKLRKAVASGKLAQDDPVIKEVLDRYNVKLAEWESFDGNPQNFLNKMNEAKVVDGHVIEGFEVQRYGKTIRTKVKIDADGTVRFTWNDKPIFSDIDLMQIGYPDGTPVPKWLHRLLSREAGFGLDSQHGDSAMTADFPNDAVAKKVAGPYVEEHTVGNEPLLFVGENASTKGYIDSYEITESPVPGSGYDLYGEIFKVTYVGAGT